jgi:hypothetical protein
VTWQLSVQLSEEDADPERLAQLANYLRSELLELDVENVTSSVTGAPPPGSRGIAITTVGDLLVTLGRSAQGLQSVISAVRGWLRRGGDAPRTVRLELDGDVLMLTRASETDQERLIELFINRHSAG